MGSLLQQEQPSQARSFPRPAKYSVGEYSFAHLAQSRLEFRGEISVSASQLFICLTRRTHCVSRGASLAQNSVSCRFRNRTLETVIE